MLKHFITRFAVIIIAVAASALLHGTADPAPARASLRYPKNVILFIGSGMDYNQIAIAQELTGEKLFMTSLPVTGTLLTTAASVQEIETLLDIFKQKKRLTGVVKTGEMGDLKDSIDVILGGGRRHFLPELSGGVRKDDRNIISEMKKVGYHYISSALDFPNFTRLDKKLLGLFHDSHMNFEIDRQEIPQMRDEPPLDYMTHKALSLLSKSPNGFFLVVEASGIHHAARHLDPVAMAKEIIALNKAVETAHQFAKKNKQTMVIVMADHETGGLASTKTTHYEYLRKLKVSASFMARQIKAGNFSPEKISEVLKTHAHFENLPSEIMDRLQQARDDAVGQTLTTLIGSLLIQRGGILSAASSASEAGHLSSPVPLFGFGPESSLFTGIIKSNLISEKISRAARVSLQSQ